ncbi:nuclear transport factor 2 family protein [Sphingosinicella terrae]|uniref:nuclear transport factor 2 family protein n=1 Tax=Sphingosinicella terrae TaxID=2172047 RepID=UPI000E0E05AE|nr:nuclear transport factor 2 family protein [Sphingosinicella terrae]
MKLRLAYVVLALALAAPTATPAAGQAAEASALTNRQIVEGFIDLFYRQGRVREAFGTYVHEDYIQHNPLAPDGRAAAIAALEPYFASQPDAVREVHRIIVDGDLAAVHVRARQNPQDRGFAIVDILRLENGKIVEHWDVIQAVPEQSANPHPMF